MIMVIHVTKNGNFWVKFYLSSLDDVNNVNHVNYVNVILIMSINSTKICPAAHGVL